MYKNRSEPGRQSGGFLRGQVDPYTCTYFTFYNETMLSFVFVRNKGGEAHATTVVAP